MKLNLAMASAKQRTWLEQQESPQRAAQVNVQNIHAIAVPPSSLLKTSICWYECCQMKPH